LLLVPQQETGTAEQDMALNIDSAFGIHAQALMLRSRRSELLAANIANAETPNYKARDFDFQTALDRATDQAGSRGLAIRVTHAAHMSASGDDPRIGDLLYRVPMQPSIDGNTVDGQMEKGAFAENSLHYMASLQFLNGRISGLLRAIRGE
jgi:flagellar basal-body rod protein FlgB